MNTLCFPKGPALAEHVENIAAAEGGSLPNVSAPCQFPMVAGGTSLVPVPPSLADLSAAALASHRAYESNLVAAADKAIETGLRLIELKARVRAECGAGFWEEYLAETFPFTARTAQRYMSQAKQSLRPGNDRLSFLKKHRATKVIAEVAKK
jgi:hypothetical protein